MDERQGRTPQGAVAAGKSAAVVPPVRPGSLPSPALAAVEALGRLFAVASIYAPTHQRVAALAAPTIESLRQACGPSESLVLELRDGAIHVEGEALPEKGSTLPRLRQDLDAVGVTRLELSYDTSAEDLLVLGRLLKSRSQRRGAATFEQAELTGLPSTIRASHQDFGRPSFDESETSSGTRVDPASLLGVLFPKGQPAPQNSGGSRGRGGGARGGAGSGAGRGGGFPGGGAPGLAGLSGGTASGLGGDVSLTGDELRSAITRSVMAAFGQRRSQPVAVSPSSPGPAEARTPAGNEVVGDAPRTRQELLRSIGEAVQSAVSRAGGASAGRSNISSILNHASQTLPQILPGVEMPGVLDALRSAIDTHLRDPFRREAQVSSSKETVRSREAEEPELSVTDLQVTLEAFVGTVEEDLGDVRPIHGAEHLGILLYYLGEDPSAAVLAGVVPRLESALSRPLREAEGEVLAGWIHDLCERSTNEEVDRRLPILLSPMASAGPGVVTDALLRPLRPPVGRPLTALWPHLVNQLLAATEEVDGPVEAEILQALAALPAEDLRECLRRLSQMPAVASGHLAQCLLVPPRARLYPLYMALLELWEAPLIVAEVIDAFFRFPPESPAMAALLVLRPDDERTRPFLARFLREHTSTGETLALRRLAAETIIMELRELPRRRRTEDWVGKAIGALRLLPCREATEFVDEVLTSKLLGILQAWPPSARQAASALDSIFRSTASAASAAADAASASADAASAAADAASGAADAASGAADAAAVPEGPPESAPPEEVAP